VDSRPVLSVGVFSVAGVSGTLAQVRESLQGFACALDVSRVSTADAAVLLADAAVIERTAAVLTARLAVRAAVSGLFRDGLVSGAHRLARDTGLSLGVAQQRLEAGRRLAEQPEVLAAANAGALSAPALAAVTDAVVVDPTQSARLVELAGQGSLGELTEECRRAKAAAVRDAETRRVRIHAHRSLRHYTDTSGAGHLSLTENPEVIAEVIAAISPLREQLFRVARREGRRERSEVLDADALVGTVRGAATHRCPTGQPSPQPVPPVIPRPPAPSTGQASGPSTGQPTGQPSAPSTRLPGPGGGSTGSQPQPAGPGSAGLGSAGLGLPGGGRRYPSAAKILVRMDLDTLLRGYPISGEVCEIAGYGPVAVSAVTDMIATGNPFLVGIATRGQRVTGVVHLGRKPTATQHSALQWAQPGCAVLGCHRVRRLERDHRQPWAQTKLTLLEDLDHLCDHHHRMKTHHGWALVPGTSKRAFVAPTDPRHPDRANRGTPKAATGTHGPPPDPG